MSWELLPKERVGMKVNKDNYRPLTFAKAYHFP